MKAITVEAALPDKKEEALAPLKSVHTNTFANLLKQMGSSLAVSTYQAGKLIVMRADGENINTHFRIFNKPMGLAADAERIAMGTAYHIWELRNVPAAGQKIEPVGKHDGCYIPRQIHITGDIDIHEMAWSGEELWFVNTRFSCLCTLDKRYSFVPRWRPPFISAYDMSDRCHLNGLAIRDGNPRYVTALGKTDSPNGWRANKASGGILMDIDSNEILYRGLSMPHSPRWYREKLWVLESGRGSLVWLNLETGELNTIVELPGFTRGLDFYGDFAFIGLSQVRESAVFSGIPLTQTLTERTCGVWVVNILTGETVAFLRFQDAVQEIFAVSILPGQRFPEVVDTDEQLMGHSYVLPDEALADVVQPDPHREFAQTYFDKGVKHYHDGQFDDAISAFQRCLKLQPDYLPARYNLGVTLGDIEQFEEAVTELKQVVQAEASHAEAYNSLGYVFSQRQNPEQAIKHYKQAIQIQPEFAKAHHNLGMTLLQLGELEEGWAESEWRWGTAQFTPFECPQPKWDGQPIPNKTLLIHTEQGAGDAIQFIRYVPMIAERCNKIILVCTPELLPLFEGCPGIDSLRTAGEIKIKDFDAYVPLMSLPHLLKTTLDTIPAHIPYLTGNSNLLPLPKSPGNARVGIVWAGSPTHGNDRNRSSQIQDWLSVLTVEGIDFYSLQKGERVKDMAALPANVPLHDLDTQIKTYADTAAIIEQLDLVISVDTSVAHLAGALGKPCWVLLCYTPDWRWLRNRDDSPWYPTMRLFRQTSRGNWSGIFDQVSQALRQETWIH